MLGKKSYDYYSAERDCAERIFIPEDGKEHIIVIDDLHLQFRIPLVINIQKVFPQIIRCLPYIPACHCQKTRQAEGRVC